MKQKLRKILALLVLSVSVLGLTACGSAKDSETIEYDSAYLQSVSDFLIGSWNGLSEADLDTYATMDEEDAQSMLDSYDFRLPLKHLPPLLQVTKVLWKSWVLM